MDNILRRDTHRLTLKVEEIKQRLERLERDSSASVGHRDGEDLVGLVEDLREAEVDVSLVLTDYIAAGCTLGEDAPKVIFHDFRGIFSCLDALFNNLKQARLELENTYTRGAITDHLGIDWGRFRNLLGHIQRHLNESHGQIDLPSEGIQVHRAQDYAITL